MKISLSSLKCYPVSKVGYVGLEKFRHVDMAFPGLWPFEGRFLPLQWEEKLRSSLRICLTDSCNG
mgnify:CR=1 FL=1